MGGSEAGVEAEADFAEGAGSGSVFVEVGFEGFFVFGGGEGSEFAFGEGEGDSGDDRAIEAGVRDDEFAVDRILERGDTEDADREFDFAIDADLGGLHAGGGGVAILFIRGASADAEGDVGAVGRGDASRRGAHESDGLIHGLGDGAGVDFEGVLIEPVEIGGVDAHESVGDDGALVPMEVDGAVVSALIEPFLDGLAVSGRDVALGGAEGEFEE